MSEQSPENDAGCRCQIVGWLRDPYEPHIPARAEWEQADDCPAHPLRIIAPDPTPYNEIAGWSRPPRVTPSANPDAP